jgi:hypothetical protein
MKTDVHTSEHGSRMVFTLLTKRARDWVKENLDISNYAWIDGKSFSVSQAFYESVVAMMEEYEDGPGLVVRKTL